MIPALLAQATQGVDIGTIPVEGQVLFIGLLFLGTLAISRFSIQVGVPAILGVLVLGLAININYLDITHQQAESLHVFALALLLFYAGLKTDIQAIRGFLHYGLALAVGGVTLATLLLGALIWLLSSAEGGAIAPGGLDAMPLGAALLIAACLGSTDAGATISVLASVRQLVPERLQHLLEFESSVNDPTALLLFGLVAGLFTTGPADGAAMGAGAVFVDALRSFVQQVGSGLVIGALFGYVARFVIDQLAQDRSQLLIVAMSIAFVDYGSCQLLGGAGLIAVYTTGLLMTNMRYRRAELNHESIQDALLPFNTMAEICLFLIFGLLVSPASLVPALPVGLATAAVLMLVVRPLSVLVFQPLSPFNRKESLFVSWCGLRGAVPLALAYTAIHALPTLPGLGEERAVVLEHQLEGLIFLVVVTNLVVQGLSLPPLCRRLGLAEAD